MFCENYIRKPVSCIKLDGTYGGPYEWYQSNNALYALSAIEFCNGTYSEHFISLGGETAHVILDKILQLQREGSGEIRGCIQKFPDWPP